MFSNESLCNSDFTGKTVPFPSTVNHYGSTIIFFLPFFPQKGVITFFDKIVKPKCNLVNCLNHARN